MSEPAEYACNLCNHELVGSWQKCPGCGASPNDRVMAALEQLDDTTESAVRLYTGLTSEELDELGGVEEP